MIGKRHKSAFFHNRQSSFNLRINGFFAFAKLVFIDTAKYPEFFAESFLILGRVGIPGPDL